MVAQTYMPPQSLGPFWHKVYVRKMLALTRPPTSIRNMKVKEITDKQSQPKISLLASQARIETKAERLFLESGPGPLFFSWHKPLERKL